MNKKGLAFTLESLMALNFLVLVMVITSFYLLHSTEYSPNKADIYPFSLNVLSVLDKQGALSAALEKNDTSSLGLFLTSLPPQYCFNLSIHNSAGAVLLSNNSGSCTFDQGQIVARRIFISSQNVYYATLRGWWNHDQ